MVFPLPFIWTEMFESQTEIVLEFPLIFTDLQLLTVCKLIF